jgi:hypothetical protein
VVLVAFGVLTPPEEAELPVRLGQQQDLVLAVRTGHLLSVMVGAEAAVARPMVVTVAQEELLAAEEGEEAAVTATLALAGLAPAAR